jgi:hypothetical protein
MLLMRAFSGSPAVAWMPLSFLSVPWLIVNVLVLLLLARRPQGHGRGRPMTTLKGTIRREDLSGGVMMLETTPTASATRWAAPPRPCAGGPQVELEGEFYPEGVSIAMTGSRYSG